MAAPKGSDARQFMDAIFPGIDYIFSDAIDWVKVHMRPEDVFDVSELEEWAESNGYIKKED